MPQDRRSIVDLIKRLIVCLARAGSDDQHPGVRYARLLNGLLRVFSRGQDSVQSRASSPKWRHRKESSHAQNGVNNTGRTNGVSGSGSATHSNGVGVGMCTGLGTSDLNATQELPPPNVTMPSIVTSANGPMDLPMPHKVEEQVVSLSQEPTTTQQAIPVSAPPTITSHSGSPTDTTPEASASSYYVPVHNSVSNSSPNPGTTHVHPSAQSQAYNTPYNTNTNGMSPPTSATHQQAQNQQMYASGPGPAPYGPPPPPRNFVQYPHPHPHQATHPHHTQPPHAQNHPHQHPQQPHNGSPPFQFDLNWPPVEVDGLTHLLSDEHSLDGDFWMSLPNHAQWPTNWPVGATTGAQAMAMNGRPGM